MTGVTTKQRLEAIDIFRGLTIAAMILVNNPGSWSHVYAPLLHAEWHGCTPTDLVFPFFLFIVGAVIPWSLASAKNAETIPPGVYQKISSRALIIFGLGLFLAAFPTFKIKSDTPTAIVTLHYLLLSLFSLSLLARAIYLSQNEGQKAKKWILPLLATAVIMIIIGIFYYDFSRLRIPGVLQRIALVYLVSSILFLHQSRKGLLVSGIALLLLYWVLMTLVPVPGGIAPNLEPETNLGAWLDRSILGSHLWIQSKTWDPEGLLSTLPAIVTGISGILCGLWLKRDTPLPKKITGILVAGLVLVLLGYLWGMVFPINKKIWTSSYVLYTSGIALLVLATVLYLVDHLGWKKWTKPFQIYGMNALFVYVMSGIVVKLIMAIKWTGSEGATISMRSWLYDTLFTSWLPDYEASLAFAIANVLFFYLLAVVLYRKKIFIKV